jgi:hypothetical protein
VRPVRSDVGRTVRARLSTKAAVINSSIATGPKYPLGVGSKIGNAHDLDRACHLASTYESWRSEVSLATKMWVISGREAPRPRNTTPSPYPALCRAGSRDGQFGGNALGHACSLTFATADITTQQAHPKRRPRVSKRHAFPTHLGCGTDVRSSDVHVGTRLGAKLPGPQPPQEYVDDLRGSFSPFRESGSGASSCPMIVA